MKLYFGAAKRSNDAAAITIYFDDIKIHENYTFDGKIARYDLAVIRIRDPFILTSSEKFFLKN
jgi:hypothetical protein